MSSALGEGARHDRGAMRAALGTTSFGGVLCYGKRHNRLLPGSVALQGRHTRIQLSRRAARGAGSDQGTASILAGRNAVRARREAVAGLFQLAVPSRALNKNLSALG